MRHGRERPLHPPPPCPCPSPSLVHRTRTPSPDTPQTPHTSHRTPTPPRHRRRGPHGRFGHRPLSLYTGSTVRQEGGWAPHCPNAMCKCALAPPKRTGALAPPQRSSALRHSALGWSRAPPGAAPRCAATCCALTQPYAVPLCPDTTLRCAPPHPSAVPLHGHVQWPCPARPPRLPPPQTAPLRIPRQSPRLTCA